jgi:hypothetical protein
MKSLLAFFSFLHSLSFYLRRGGKKRREGDELIIKAELIDFRLFLPFLVHRSISEGEGEKKLLIAREFKLTAKRAFVIGTLSGSSSLVSGFNALIEAKCL